MMTQHTETFPELKITHTAAFEILRMFLRPFLIDLRPSAQRPNTQMHIQCERSGVSIDFLIECDEWAMPRVAITQQDTPLLSFAFSKRSIYFDMPDVPDTLSIKQSCEALIEFLVDRVKLYMYTLQSRFLSR